MVIGIAFSKSLADKFGKRDVFGTSLFLSAMCLLLFYFYEPQSISLIFLTQLAHGFFYGISTPILWAMIFGLKAGLSIGGALVAGILATYGYDEQLVVQSPETINGIISDSDCSLNGDFGYEITK